ncbi:NTP-binding helicase protein [Rhizobium phage RHph_Y2_6]|uniref:NTP-binding helicase protein n=2 Tax=Acanvirus TaxID=3044653 RepID=A0AAE7VM90_9CAUD|nr:NTP-binding helicase protein [Rhizobium phage RHph_Y2_6]YP_010658373.1 NTP-binding helicase protein [Rhizobium phage RHEph16]QIG68804.1 NTP-binding helicase protein [Rhizobium phage RHph_Y2_6]QXV74372.1 NTP-binding helicase protein [Rhizobium phage RHEph16]
MSEEDVPSMDFNPQLVLISGESGSGKSASLRNLKNQEGWLFMNCEAGKRLPFKNNFEVVNITDPYQTYEGLNYVKGSADKVGAIIDTSTFLMDMHESVYVVNSPNTQSAWGTYAQFWKNLMQQYVAPLGKPVIILAHVMDIYDEKNAEMKTQIPVKGSLKNNGIEAYFSTNVMTKKVPLRELEEYKNSMLTITEDEEMLGFKHCFQTRLTKKTIGTRIRSPIGMFTKEETYIDNDAQVLLDHLKEFYS